MRLVRGPGHSDDDAQSPLGRSVDSLLREAARVPRAPSGPHLGAGTLIAGRFRLERGLGEGAAPSATAVESVTSAPTVVPAPTKRAAVGKQTATHTATAGRSASAVPTRPAVDPASYQ